MRAECLDQLLIFSHRQLEQVPCTYVEHYKGLGPIETSSLRHHGPPSVPIQAAGPNVAMPAATSSTSTKGLPQPSVLTSAPTQSSALQPAIKRVVHRRAVKPEQVPCTAPSS